MEYFPIFIDLKGKNVLVIGDYRVLEFKIKKMIEAGAKITYLTELWPEQIKDLDKSDNVIFIRDQFNASYLDDKWLVVCGSDNSDFNCSLFFSGLNLVRSTPAGLYIKWREFTLCMLIALRFMYRLRYIIRSALFRQKPSIVRLRVELIFL